MASIQDYLFDLGIDALVSIVNVLSLAGVFWLLNFTPFFNLEIVGFLETYGIAIFAWVFGWQLASSLFEIFKMEIRGM